MASLVHGFPGDCTHPGPPLMKVGTIPPTLHQGSQRVPPPRAYAFREFLASCSHASFLFYNFSPSAFRSIKQMHLEVTDVRILQKQNCLEYVK